MKRLVLVLAAVLTVASLPACSKRGGQITRPQEQPTTPLKDVLIGIDWVPSPEYYGFYYALEAGFYREAGLNVTIAPGNGAPSVAAQIGVGALVLGTTTSDNVLRQVVRGARFDRAVPLLRFNPTVIASLAKRAISSVRDVRGKHIGTNQQSAVYQQFLFALENAGVRPSEITEYPINWGGNVELREQAVDAILAYTTNVVVDLEIENVAVTELFLGNEGLESFGLVLLVAGPDALRRAGFTSGEVDRFVTATLRGYSAGGENIEDAVDALQRAAPTLNRLKAAVAIRKIRRLNAETSYKLDRLDRWVTGSDVTESARAATLALFQLQR